MNACYVQDEQIKYLKGKVGTTQIQCFISYTALMNVLHKPMHMCKTQERSIDY